MSSNSGHCNCNVWNASVPGNTRRGSQESGIELCGTMMAQVEVTLTGGHAKGVLEHQASQY